MLEDVYCGMCVLNNWICSRRFSCSVYFDGMMLMGSFNIFFAPALCFLGLDDLMQSDFEQKLDFFFFFGGGVGV